MNKINFYIPYKGRHMVQKGLRTDVFLFFHWVELKKL